MWRRALLLISALTMTAIAVPAPAPASARFPDGHFRIQNVKSGKYLQSPSDLPGSSRVQQESRSSVGWQEFEAIPRGAYDNLRQYLLQRNIGINGGGITSGAAAIFATPDSRVNQQWELRLKPGDVYELVNRGSGMCLGISGASTLVGAHAAQFPCDGFANQRWRFTPW